jgi:hypothetical protein
MESINNLDIIIKRNKELVAQMELCSLGDMATLCKIQRELERNNKDILERTNNYMEGLG